MQHGRWHASGCSQTRKVPGTGSWFSRTNGGRATSCQSVSGAKPLVLVSGNTSASTERLSQSGLPVSSCRSSRSAPGGAAVTTGEVTSCLDFHFSLCKQDILRRRGSLRGLCSLSYTCRFVCSGRTRYQPCTTVRNGVKKQRVRATICANAPAVRFVLAIILTNHRPYLHIRTRDVEASVADVDATWEAQMLWAHCIANGGVVTAGMSTCSCEPRALQPCGSGMLSPAATMPSGVCEPCSAR